MNKKEKTIFGLLVIVYISGIFTLFFKYDYNISILPKCIGQGFYVYYDNKDKSCKCYNGYGRIDGKIGCFKK